MNGPPTTGETGSRNAGGAGRLRIADRVIEKIAGQAAREVDRAGGAGRRVLGVAVGSGDTAPPRVQARMHGDVATVSIDLSVAWPAPLREVTVQVRQRVTERLAELAGVRQAQVDIRVIALVADTPTERRVS
ncbi:MAG: Asp23/Gls24 family envelope stress response protein [Geodermatophilaceae bacterium]|nr:Asp23/Gls24 family envelope stress response protein [Geodermatophilaceae bacterium]